MNKLVAAVAILLLAIIAIGSFIVVLGVMLPGNEKTPEDLAREIVLGDTGVKSGIVDKVSYSIVSIKPVNEVIRPLFGEPAFKNVFRRLC